MPPLLSPAFTTEPELEPCLGVFYWEPECYNREYIKGAFNSDGTPTDALDAFAW